MEDFPYSVRIHESILMSYFKRYLQRLVKFCQRRKKLEVNFALNCESRVGLQRPENTVQIYVLKESLRGLAVQKFTQI